MTYDEFGRANYRFDWSDHMRPESHSTPHFHRFELDCGQQVPRGQPGFNEFGYREGPAENLDIGLVILRVEP